MFPPGDRHDRFWILGLFFVLVLLKIPLVLNQMHPHLFFDEGFYLYKAKVVLENLRWFNPAYVFDRMYGLYKPLYSIVISLGQFSEDPSIRYRSALCINALLLSSIVFPVHVLCKKYFHSRRRLITFLVGCWSLNFAYSLSVMSEALYIPLFVWIGVLYARYIEKPTFLNALAVGACLAATVMTRNAGVALIVAVAMATPFDFETGALKFASRAEVFRRLPMTGIALLAWCFWELWKTANGGVARQTIAEYTQSGVFQIFKSVENMILYVKIWLGQLTYLNLSTYLLFLFLLLPLFKLTNGVKEQKKGPLPLGYFLVLLSFFALLPGTVHMIKLKLGGSLDARYDMYGRYADMVIPFILVFGLGNAFSLKVKKLFSPGYAKRTIAFFAVSFICVLISFLVVPQPIGIRVLNTGVAWYGSLTSGWPHLPKVILFLVLIVFFLVFFIDHAPLSKKMGNFGLTIVLLFFQAANTTCIDHKIQRYLELNRSAFYDKAEEIRKSGGRLYYHDNKGTYLHHGVYFFFTDFVPIGTGKGLTADNVWVIYQNRIIPYRDFLSQTSEPTRP